MVHVHVMMHLVLFLRPESSCLSSLGWDGMGREGRRVKWSHAELTCLDGCLGLPAAKVTPEKRIPKGGKKKLSLGSASKSILAGWDAHKQARRGSHCGSPVRAALFLRVQAKITCTITVGVFRTIAYGVFDHEFDCDSPERSCSHPCQNLIDYECKLGSWIVESATCVGRCP